ncbi:16S rRNA (adenine(1518)-N(6)/adenine(1519)-N(6))-dimethyltransferase RsmA [Compostibacter hankyongensis]|uniref:Ribosomal RNA small subunit methyltransferase A n=1 Tax=Compostibacter hankyongensis TaxID=1007089 RepID=A0ABP8FET3_9BACT
MYTLKKSLGQHFLRDEAICKQIVQALPVSPGMQLLEIGPGAGAISRYLAEIPGVDYRAVEVDAEKIAYLRQHYPALEGKLILGDILETVPPFDGLFSVIGNFPYNISSQILFRILEWKTRVPCMVGMFQREVARRIAAGPGGKDYGILSVLLQAFYRVEYLFEVEPKAFEPPPKVMSAVIRLHYLGNPYMITDEKRFFRLVKAAFGQRRKMLRNPLKPFFEKTVLEEPVLSKRAEQLSVREFVDLSKRMI